MNSTSMQLRSTGCNHGDNLNFVLDQDTKQTNKLKQLKHRSYFDSLEICYTLEFSVSPLRSKH